MMMNVILWDLPYHIKGYCRQNPDGSLYCLVDAYEDRDYLLLQSFSPDCLDGVSMWFKVYKKNQRPTLFEKGDQLYRMKNHIK